MKPPNSLVTFSQGGSTAYRKIETQANDSALFHRVRERFKGDHGGRTPIPPSSGLTLFATRTHEYQLGKKMCF